MSSKLKHRYPRWLREALYELAIDANIMPAGGIYRRPFIRPSAFSAPDGGQVVWNLPYSAAAVAAVGGRVDLARGFVENMTELAVTEGPDTGMIPRSVGLKGNQGKPDGSQTPLLAWLCWRLHELDPDEGFLSQVYPALAASIDWWQSPRRDVDGDGLSEYAGSTPRSAAHESGHAYSPERDLVMGEPASVGPDGLVHEPIADVFLNASLYAEMHALHRIAELVDSDRTAQWVQRRDQLRARMNDVMWDEELGAFYPVVRVDLSDSRPRVYRHTPALLQPMWAGLATEQQAERIVARLLETPRKYPVYDGVLRVVVDQDRYHGYEVITDALHPTAGTGPAAGGVEIGDGRLLLRFSGDRGPAVAPYSHLSVDVDVDDPGETGGVTITAVDRDGDVRATTESLDPSGSVTWVIQEARLGIHGDTFMRGLRSLEVTTPTGGVSEIRLRYWRVDRQGLLSRYGLKSAHPLDGKHPAPGAPTDPWSGTVWGPHNFHACQALRRYGYEALARGVALAYCDGVAASLLSTGSATEHHDAATGRGYGAEGHTWGAGVALVLMDEFLEDT